MNSNASGNFNLFFLVAILLGHPVTDSRGDPLPEFVFRGVALHPDDLEFTPTDQLIHPAIVKTEDRIQNPLGRYYLYYAPHKHIAISMAYADSLEGPSTEFRDNPVLEGPSAPEVRWIPEEERFFLWGHRKNSQTELWTSKDGIHFEHDSVSLRASDIGTRNASYNRVYEYPLEKFGSRYVTLYTGFMEERGIRCIWLAHSTNGRTWTPIKTPLAEPIEGEADNLYGPALLRWKGRNFLTYQDGTTWRGGNLKYVALDQELSTVSDGSERLVLIDPPEGPPMENRLRGSEFYLDGDTRYLFTSGARSKRLIAWATAEVKPGDVTALDP
ncbi:MAG: hypothetical protein AAGJ79_03310 [Verrucomicrobiota bacterium]